jgi:hypothetical protein
MCGRVARTLCGAAVAAATIAALGLAATGPAGAATGGRTAIARHKTSFAPSAPQLASNANCPLHTVTVLADDDAQSPSDNCGIAGYAGTGRDFRFAQALVTVPDHPGAVLPTAPNGPDPELYVALDDSTTISGGVVTPHANYDFARVGIAPCPVTGAITTVVIAPNAGVTDCTGVTGNTSGWVAFSAFATPGSPPSVTVYGISSAVMGDGIAVNAFFNQAGNTVRTVITLPAGTTFNNTYPVTGPVYTQAQALADWTIDHASSPATLAAPATPPAKVRDAQFFQGRFTTLSGQMGTFSGPWTLYAWEATSNGHLPPSGTLIAQPSYLWNDGQGFGWGDAFGVWRFPF